MKTDRLRIAAIWPHAVAELRAAKPGRAKSQLSTRTRTRGTVTLRLDGPVTPWALEYLREDLAMLASRDEVGAVVLRVNSPGGFVEGVAESTELLRRLSKVKRTIALCEGYACSAAYWLASAAREVVATPSCLIGSCGAIAILADESEYFASLGVRLHPVASADGKLTGTPGLPVSDADLERVKTLVDAAATQFLRDVAASPRMTASQVLDAFRDGGVWTADEARKRGLCDRVTLCEDVLQEIAKTTREDYSALTGAAAVQRFRELLAERSGGEWWEAKDSDHRAIVKQFPTLAARCDQHVTQRSRDGYFGPR
jgi:signal peptide peptidase SppA